MSSVQAYSTFFVDGLYFGILTSEVIELTKGLEVTPVPLGPIGVSGFINLRGQIVTAIDMRKRLGLHPIEHSDTTISLFFQDQGTLFGLLVDDVSDILELDQSSFEEPPSNISLASRELILGVHKLPQRLLLILDPHKIISGIDTVLA
jgi:purine-binding chemotaxis protein CheW